MDREDIMGTPLPELKQLWIRVLKRVHPDLAIDEQDRVRCERLTKLANEAYQAGDEEALRAVLRPSQPANAGAPQAYTGSRQGQKVSPPSSAEPRVQQGSPAPNRSPKRSFKSWFWLSNVPPVATFTFKQLLPVAIAVVILIWGGFFFYSVTTSRHAVTNGPTAQVDSVKAPTQAHVEAPDAGIWQPRPPTSYENGIQNQISQNLNPSTVVDTTVGASRQSSPTKVSLFTTSGHPSLDSSCLNSASDARTVGPSEWGREPSLNVDYDCSHKLQDHQQAPLKTSPPVANSVDPSLLYMKQMRERLYQSFSNYERVDANVPPGNSAEMWFDVNRDGSLSNVRVGKPSGWDSLDYACMRAVQRTETVGALPEDYKLRALPATFACTYSGSNALRISKSVDSATDRSDLYVGSVRDTTHE
jgi:TonB C terminal